MNQRVNRDEVKEAEVQPRTSLTIFLTEDERRAAIRALKRRDSDRRRAFLSALGVKPEGSEATRG